MFSFKFGHYHRVVGAINRIPEAWQGNTMDCTSGRINGLINQTKYLEEELDEYLVALTAFDGEEQADALGDMLFIALGYLHKLNPEKTYGDTVLSVKSDFCSAGFNLETFAMSIAADILTLRLKLMTCPDDAKGVDTLYNVVNKILILAAGSDIEIEAILDEVCRCNQTKFDLDENVAAGATYEKYQALGIETIYRPCSVGGITYYVTFINGDQTVNGKFYPHDKWVKSINFKEPKHYS